VIHHRAEAYLKLLPEKHIPKSPVMEFWGIHPTNDLDSKIPGVQDVFDFKSEWPKSQILEPPSEKYWVLAPGTTAESRKWPTERFAALAEMVQKEMGWTGIIVGGAAESEVAQRLVADSTLNLEDWTGRGSVGGLAKLFKNAQFTVCNDSGLAHVASLCDSFVEVIWGGGNPKRTEPMGPGKVQITFNPVDCWPCERNTCSQLPGKQLECLRGISAERVWKEIKTGLKI
jgi:ADP-heptose:LPS heptosyltransferase